MEQNIQIATDDGHIIYGVITNPNKSDKLIIFVHGLSGNKNEHIFYNSARFFPQHGFATFRFDLFGGNDKSRELKDCTIDINAEDLSVVIAHFQDQYDQIHLVGHSLGGPIILLAQIDNITSVALRDPSFNVLKNITEDLTFDERIDMYILGRGTNFLLMPEVIKSREKLTDGLVDHFSKPTKIICAGEGVLYKSRQPIISTIPVQCEFTIIDGARHCFDEEGVEMKLFEETLDRFSK